MTPRSRRDASRGHRRGEPSARMGCAPADPLGAAVRRLARRPAQAPAPDDLGQRVSELERQVQEVRTRINALFFAVLAAALGDLAGRLVLG